MRGWTRLLLSLCGCAVLGEVIVDWPPGQWVIITSSRFRVPVGPDWKPIFLGAEGGSTV